MTGFLKSLIQLILAPERGWEDISHDGTAVRRLLSRGFYPLIGIAALTVFLGLFHHGPVSVVWLMQESIVTFVKYFLSYYIASAVFGMYIHRYITTELNEKRNNTYIIYSLSLLALIDIFQNCLPMELPFAYFFVFYVAIIMYKGMRYMTVEKDRAGSFMIMAIATVIAPPFIIGMLFNILFPNH